MKTAAVEPRIGEKSLMISRIIVDTVIAKYRDHLPLYRQSAMLGRETGVEIHRATMDGGVMRVGELLLPVAEEIKRELVMGSYLQADETPVDVPVREGKGKNHMAYLWKYSRPGAGAAFEFQMGRGREGPQKLLRRFAEILQTDGYSAYGKVGAADGRTVRGGAGLRAGGGAAGVAPREDGAAARCVAAETGTPRAGQRCRRAS